VSSRRRHTRFSRDWSSDVCSSDLKKVLVAAGDTFRAAAVDQLTIWANRLGVDIVKHKQGADPAAVAYDAVEAARARGHDVVIVEIGRASCREGGEVTVEGGAGSTE